MKNRQILLDVLVEQLPLEYVDALINGITRLYKEADQSVKENTQLGEAEKKYVRPHLLRGLIETHFRNSAIDTGLIAAVASNDADTAEYTVVTAGSVELTHSKTDGPNAVPSLCDFREQRSDANNMLHQQKLFPAPVEEKKQSKTYAILTHGPAKQEDEDECDEQEYKLGYLKIGFPSPDGDGWAELPIDLIDIKEKIQVRDAKEAITVDVELEKARQPKLKQTNFDKNDNKKDDE